MRGAWPASQSIEHPVGANVYGSAVLRTEPTGFWQRSASLGWHPQRRRRFADTSKAVEAVVKSVRRNNISPEAVEVSRVVLTTAYDGFGQAQKFVGYRARRGTGAVIIWDEGRAEIRRDDPGHMSVVLHGQKLGGGFGLTRTGEQRWLLVKVRDEFALPGSDITADRPESVRTGRRWEDLVRR